MKKSFSPITLATHFILSDNIQCWQRYGKNDSLGQAGGSEQWYILRKQFDNM